MYAKNSDVYLLFYNPLSRKSFERIKNILNIMKLNEQKKDSIYILIESKYDIKKENDTNKNIVSEEEALEYADKNNLVFCHLSNKVEYEKGINEIFSKILNLYLKNKYILI